MFQNITQVTAMNSWRVIYAETAEYKGKPYGLVTRQTKLGFIIGYAAH